MLIATGFPVMPLAAGLLLTAVVVGATVALRRRTPSEPAAFAMPPEGSVVPLPQPSAAVPRERPTREVR